MGKVYIRIRAYNAEKTIRRAIKSVLGQTFQDFAFYICDNGSTDRTRKIIDFYARKDSRIVPFYNQVNMVYDEVSAAFRDLPHHIEADDYYCTLDADDEYCPTFLEDMLTFMEENGLDIACCGTEMFQVDHKGNRRYAGNRVLQGNLVLDQSQFGTYYPYYHCFMRPNWGKLFKGSTTYDMVTDPDQVQGWPRAYGGDTIMSFQALRHAKRMGVLGKVLHRYYIMPASVSSQFSPGRVSSDQILLEDALSFLEQYGPISVPNYNFVYTVYMNALSDTIRVVLQSQEPVVKKLDAIMDICNCAHTVRVAAWENFDADAHNLRKHLFSQIVQWMLSLEEIPDEKAEGFCRCGEFASAAAERAEDWVTFKKLRAAFLLQNQRDDEAQTILSELDELRIGDGGETVATDLEDETNFSRYLDLLFRNKEQYIIFVVARDTPWGSHFTRSLTTQLMALGLKIDLYGKFRYAYAAVLDQGERVFEKISPNTTEKVEWSGQVGDIAVSLESRGFEAAPSNAKIELDGQDYSVSLRGLNIVVYDKASSDVVDSVNFDTWTESLTCTRPSMISRALAQWHSEHPGIGLLCFNKPDFPTTNLTPNEEFIVENVHSQGDSFRLIDHPKLPLRMFFAEKEDILEVITPPKSYHDVAGVRRFEDVQGRQVHTVAGHRVTTDQPECGGRTIYMVGGCSTFGIGASDRNTVASCLQRLCNEKVREESILVENYGYYLSNEDRTDEEELQILKALPVRPGDIVLCDWGFSNSVPFLDLRGEGQRPHNYGEIFFDIGPVSGHLTENGYRLTAEKIFERLEASGYFHKSLCETQQTMPFNGAELDEYKATLKKLYDRQYSVGACVMNCNPFTLGHRYLIEQALLQCAHLVVFVVEEDRSCFSFQDRIQLVKEGLSDLKNVTVLPSGKFILSSLTFSEYFNKSELQNRTVDPSRDVYLFAKEIAPCLHITKRFVGSEPFDTVTKQYNLEMKRILPSYGIETIEIERLVRSDEKVISASVVRECIKKNDIQSLMSMVPITTYQYIEHHLHMLQKALSADDA